MHDAAIINAMTVDVEDHFHVSALEPVIDRSQWDGLDQRVEPSTHRLLDLFARTGVNATFFTLAWVAERYPALIRRIVAEGHELASHGCDHTRITGFDHGQLLADAHRSRSVLADIGGCEVVGYRAPSFSITARNLWALDVLREAGYRYSSSIYPVRHDLYGIPDAPRFAFIDRRSGMLEIPVTTTRLADRNVPIGGGGFFRLYPYPASRWLLRRVNRLERQPCIFYTHPWEYDPDQPRYDGVPWKSRFRHYLNLDRTEGRLARLLGDMRWDRMDRIFLDDSHARPQYERGASGWT